MVKGILFFLIIQLIHSVFLLLFTDLLQLSNQVTYFIYKFVYFRVSVERARGTPRGSDVWRGSGRGGDLPPPPPRRPRRDARLVYY